MRKWNRILLTAVGLAALMCITPQPALALTEAEVQAQVSAVGKEAVTGNVLIWFLCAIAFLKVSQKIDSFLSSLGINVGHTGGSMLSEVMLAARTLGGHRSGSRGAGSAGSSASGGNGTPFLSGGLAGVVSRSVTAGAVQSVTSPGGGGTSSVAGGGSGGLGDRMYASSVSKGGSFANSVIGAVAHGDISRMGSITGDKAVTAMNSYMGNATLESCAADIPSYSNVEIGGGRITGTETSVDHPEGVAFGMYSTAQYAAPDGDYTTVYTADGASWYKQYAVDAVKKTPYQAPDGKIAYSESIIQKLPPSPKRKDKL